ncbi:HeH/LEM domain-containing protein [Enterococcus rotai]
MPDDRQAPLVNLGLTVRQLKVILDEQGIVYPSDAKKQELINLLEG